MKEMCTIIPQGSCPICGHKQFIVHEIDTNIYLTDQDGAILDHKELSYKAIGICTNCKAQFEMMPTSIGFIPLTKLRKIIYEYSPSVYINETELINSTNPMEVR